MSPRAACYPDPQDSYGIEWPWPGSPGFGSSLGEVMTSMWSLHAAEQGAAGAVALGLVTVSCNNVVFWGDGGEQEAISTP